MVDMQTPESGRFHLLSAGELMSPSKCVYCGNGPVGEVKEPLLSGVTDCDDFVDGTVVFEFYGSMYLCKNCVLESANLFGAMSPEKTVVLRTELSKLAVENIELSGRVAELEAQTNALMAELVTRRANIISDSIPVEPEIKDETPSPETPGEGISTGADSPIELPVVGEGQGDKQTVGYVSKQEPRSLFDIANDQGL